MVFFMHGYANTLIIHSSCDPLNHIDIDWKFLRQVLIDIQKYQISLNLCQNNFRSKIILRDNREFFNENFLYNFYDILYM